MGIFKDTLYPFVHDQLYIRQSIAAHGLSMYGKNNFNGNNIIGDSPGYRGGDDSSDINLGTNMEGVGSYAHFSSDYHSTSFGVYDMTDDERELRNKLRGKTIPHEYWHSWMTQKYCGIRMASMVDLVSEDILDLDYEFNGVILEEELLGFGLARNYMLEGGTLLTPEGFNNPQMRAGFPSQGKLLGTAYGDPLSRSDSRRDDYGEHHGIVPMAGITNVNIRTKSAYGSLREAKVEFVCHNLRQLSVMELLYMRPGYPVLLEWGWTPYVGNDRELENGFTYLSDMDRFWGRRGTGNQTLLQHEIGDLLLSKRKNNSGCYDGILGLCKNFSYTARDDGGFNCSTELMATGDVLSSLKPKNITIVGNINIDAVEWVDPNDHSKGYKVGTFKTSGANYIKMPALMDFLLATYDYVYGVAQDKASFDYTAGGGYKDYQSRHYPGDDDEYGTEDDETKTGRSFNKNPRNQTAPITRDGLAYIDRRVTFNVDRAAVKANYENEFFDNGSGNIPKIFTSDYLMHFFEGRTGWANFWKGAENLATYYASAGSYIAWGIQQALDFFTNDARVLSEGYIRMDAFLYMINARCMTDTPKKKDQKITCYQTLQYFPLNSDKHKYKTHNMNSYAHKSQRMLKSLWWEEKGGYVDRSELVKMLDGSVDPYTCLFPRQYEDQFGFAGDYSKGDFVKPCRNYVGYPDEEFEVGKAFDKSFPGGKQSNVDERVAEKNNAFNSIGHIMLNIEFLIDVHERLFKQSEFTGYGVGDFLKEVLNGVNEATGGQHKLAIVSDNEFNHISNIVDLNKPTKTKFQDIFVFDILSNHSAVRDFSFNTAIPTAMSSTIAVAAGNPDSIDSLDAVSFSAMNRGVSNRLYRNTPPSDKKKTKIDYNKLIKQLRSEQNELVEILEALSEFQAKVASGEYFTKGNDAWKNKVASNKSMLSRASTLIDIIGTKDKNGMAVKNPPTPTPIPISVDLTLDGISGIVIGQMFRLNESRLPKQYRSKRICFIVIAEETSVDADGQWITKIKGQMQLFPGVPSELSPTLYDETEDQDAHNDRESEKTKRTGQTPWEDVGVSEAEWYSMAPRDQKELLKELKDKEAAEAAEVAEAAEAERLELEASVSPCDGVTCNENELHVEVNGECECQCAPGFNLVDGKCVAIEAEDATPVEPPIDDPVKITFNDSNPDVTHELSLSGINGDYKWKIAKGWAFAGMSGWESYVPAGKINKQQRKSPTGKWTSVTNETAVEMFFMGQDTPENMHKEGRAIYYSEYLDEWAYDEKETFDELESLYEYEPEEFEGWKASGFSDDYFYDI